MESKPDLFNQSKAVSPQVCDTKNVGFYFPPNSALKTNIQTSNFATKHNCLSKPALSHFYLALPPCAAPWEVILFPPNTLASMESFYCRDVTHCELV